MVAFALILLIFFIAFLANLVQQPAVQNVLGYLSVLDHMTELSRGIVDTRRLVFYVSTTLFFLFAASRALEDRSGGDAMNDGRRPAQRSTAAPGSAAAPPAPPCC